MKAKRLLFCIFVLILVLVISAMPASATGTANNLNQMPLEMGAQCHTGIQDAAEHLREGLKQLETNIPVSFQLDKDSFDGSQQAADHLAIQVQELALAHTGVPDEGDYLLGYIVYLAPTDVRFAQNADGWQFTVNYYCAYWTTPQQEAELDVEIEKLVQQLELKSDLTDYQKVSAIYNYICSNVTYDYEHKEDDSYALKQTAYAAVVNKTAVCQGYATLFYRLALEAGVDCRYITGFAGEYHAWNLVKLDGQYYYTDVTWDSEAYQFQYFLKSISDFWDHQPDSRYETAEFKAAHPIAPKSYPHETTSEADFEYQVFNGVAVLLHYNGNEKRVLVPSSLGGYPLYEVASCAFFWNDAIESITFSEGIQLLNSEAILECKNLKTVHLPSTVDFTGSKVADFKCNVACGPHRCPSVETITVAEGNPNLVVVDNVLYSSDMTILRYYPGGDPREVFQIPEGVISIGAFAFDNAKNLKEVIMPDSVVRLQMSSFEECHKLENVRISENCRVIDQYVFSETALKTIHIPASLELLYSGSFGNECMLETITVDPENPYYYAEDGVLYGHYVEGIQTDDCHIAGDWLVKYPAGSNATVFTVPDGIIGLDQHAFDSAVNLQEIILPDSLHTIYSGVFWNCSGLAKLELPGSLKKIYDSPIKQCTGITNLVIPASVELIGYNLVPNTPDFDSVVFLGDLPEMYFETFQWDNVDIYYPAGNTTYLDAIEMNADSTRWHIGCAQNYDAAQKHADYGGVRWIEACEIHQFESFSKPNSCTGYGFDGQKCSVCGLVEITGAWIPPKGHTVVSIPPSCEAPGSEYCSTCMIMLSMSEDAAPGHNYDENGVCTNCGFNPTYVAPIEDTTVGLSAQDVLFIYLAIIAVIVGIALCVMLLSKLKKKSHIE